MSTQGNLASSTITGGPSRTIMRGTGEQTDSSLANAPLIALDDCKCPICLDYFIDVRSTLRRGNTIYLWGQNNALCITKSGKQMSKDDMIYRS